MAPKITPPQDKQLSNESLKFWSGVTDAIHAKQFGKATQIKVDLEEAQRVKARERESKGEEFQPLFFKHVVGNDGRPDLTERGRKVLNLAQKDEWDLDGVV
jgi:hypothetical protein